MTRRHLEIFTAVCRTGTTHAAADALHISQPAVSKAITELERQYGLQLFERLGHRLHLTAAGAAVRDHALRVLADFAALERTAREAGQREHLRIGASVTVGTCLLPPLLPQLTARLPGLTYEVVVHNTSHIEQMTAAYALDVGVVEGAVSDPRLSARPVAEDALVLTVRAGHPLCSRAGLTPRDLEDYPFLTREAGSRTRNQLEQQLHALGLHLHSNYACSSVEAIKQGLLYTDGIAVLSARMIAHERAAGTLTVLPLPALILPRTIRMICHIDKQPTPAMRVLAELFAQADPP